MTPTVSSFASFLASRFGQSGIVDAEANLDSVASEIRRQAVIFGVWPANAADEPRLLDRLKEWMTEAPTGIVAACGNAPLTVDCLRRRLERGGLTLDFAGSAPNEETENHASVAVLAGQGACAPTNAPPSFRVVAIMPSFNEADIIVPSIESLIREGLEVYLLDNWSTDGTERLASRFLGKGLLKIERFPMEGDRGRYDLRQTLRRIGEIADEIEADWIVANDADEVRCSPWPGVTLRDAIYTVDRRGFNAIDYTNVVFEPTDDSFRDGASLDHFRYFRFGPDPWHLLRINSWKRPGSPVDLVESGGHEVRFEGRRVFPFKFLLKHYPIRSQTQGERKVFRERKARYSEEERRLGWHVQYDQVREGESFLRDPSTLIEFDEDRFPEEFLIERLSGVGSIPAPTPGSRTIPREDSSDIEMARSNREEEVITEAAETQSLADAEALGAAEAELADARLRLRESLEREQRLMSQVFDAEERLAETLSTEHELRIQIARYAEFYEAIKKSRAWKAIQFLRRLIGREW